MENNILIDHIGLFDMHSSRIILEYFLKKWLIHFLAKLFLLHQMIAET